EVEMCNGAGVCRKLNSGAMCPSFMATRQEEHSTRGRANLLRAALAGWLPHAELTGPRMYAAMELCVSCKTCKAECPSSVDMARLKTEFLSQYYDKHSRPLRDHLFSHIDTLSKLAGGWRAPLANRVLSWDVTKSVLDRGFGISRERTLPRFARRSFAHEAGTSANRAAPPVVLFVDTYNAYSYPHVAQAAADVLTAAGYRVIIPNVTDAGRPALSKGMIELARAKATQVLAALERYARTGAPIIFLEPSDWSAVVDDYAALLPDDRRRDVVARHSFTFEQFIANAAAQGELRLHFDAAPRQVLLHGHCHQKALGGTAATVRMLSLPPGYRVTELDTSCCGMAGAFGYEAEHYDISLKMGELRLLPAVRAAAVDTLIVAAGVSCRQQIAHGAGRTALHPAEALRLALVDE
ncbi:MAG: 4Fe-4S dicluster domain-containing protein, partial [Caldilineaceae bacterium]|nr:4Fe-4S dicluster domain-containing protein [Caldilineaceae bacterium]